MLQQIPPQSNFSFSENTTKALIIAAALAHEECIKFDPQHVDDIQIAVKIIAALLMQWDDVKPGDHANLPFTW